MGREGEILLSLCALFDAQAVVQLASWLLATILMDGNLCTSLPLYLIQKIKIPQEICSNV